MNTIYFRRSFERALGTYPLQGKECAAAIHAALEVGYRAFDTAQMYGNEADVGAALADTGVARDELLITTKVHPDNFAADRFLPSVEQSLRDLQVEQVDVLLLHWPPASGEVRPSLEELEKVRQKGLAAHVGVSNYTIAMMRQAAEIIGAPVATNQVEFHPLIDQSVLMAGAAEVGIPLSAYSSVARGEVFKYPLFAEIGESYDKSAGQIVLRWILQKGVSINTMSRKPENLRANFDVMDFSLSSVDMARIDAMTATGYRMVTRDIAPWAPDWD
ncbi:MAG: aldo/keto reductase [Pseudomonadota bacterium]